MWDDDERKGEGETRCRLIACSSRKAPAGLTFPSDRRIAINSTISDYVSIIFLCLSIVNLYCILFFKLILNQSYSLYLPILYNFVQ